MTLIPILLWILALVKAEINESVKIISSKASYDVKINKNNESEKNRETCITEAGLDFSHIAMVATDTLPSMSVKACAVECLTRPDIMSQILVAYKKGAFYGHEFKCLCAQDMALDHVQTLPKGHCFRKCPESSESCGNPSEDVLSAYCMRHSCRSHANEPICAKRLPHDAHGCVFGHQISWAHAHNVRNFSAETEGSVACIWECHDHHPSSMYSLTRRVGKILTCSCGYEKSVIPDDIVEPDFCAMLPDASSTTYTVNCVGDLDEDGNVKGNESETNCESVFPLGCIYSELLNSAPKITIDNLARPEVRPCHSACSSVFKKANHVGIRWIEAQSLLECACLDSSTWNSSLLGPDLACDIDCWPRGTGLLCGGPRTTGFPAFTLYCLHRGQESVEDWHEEEETSLEFMASKPLLQAIEATVSRGVLFADVLVFLLSLVCLMLIAIVTYLCFAKGISSLSKDII